MQYTAEQVRWALEARKKEVSEGTNVPHRSWERRAELGLGRGDAPARILAITLKEWDDVDERFPYTRETLQAEFDAYPPHIREQVLAALEDADV